MSLSRTWPIPDINTEMDGATLIRKGTVFNIITSKYQHKNDWAKRSMVTVNSIYKKNI